jgi:polar amino acid transport system substrate-binding protein
MPRYLTLACMAALIAASCAGAAHAEAAKCEPEKVATKYPKYANQTVKIAASPTGPPFTYADPVDPNKMTGLEVEMIEAAMKCAGLKYEYNKGAWAGLLQSMFNGVSDVMAGNVNYRPDRAQRVDFVLYFTAGATVLVQKGNPKKTSALVDLCGETGSATVGGSSAQEIDEQSKKCVAQGKAAINFIPAADADAAYRQVSNGRNDFVMDDAGSAAARLTANPDLSMAFTIKSDRSSGFVVAKGNDEILQAVATGVEALEQDGRLTVLMKKYGLDPSLLIPVKIEH